jgi:hypothetical protein
MMCCIRVPESLHFVVVFPVAHNSFAAFNPGLEAALLHPGLICDAPSGLEEAIG